MKIKNIDPKTIKIPEVRVTARFDEEKLAMLSSSMQNAGQVAPIKCLVIDGEFVLVDGLHRLEHALKEHWEKISIVYEEGDMAKALMQNIFLDHLRGKHPVSEMRKVIEALYKEENVPIEDIVRGTGLTQAYIEKLLILSDLTPMVLEALDDERIGIGHAYALTKLKNPAQQEVVFNQLLTYRWNVKDLENYIKMVLDTPAPVVAGPVEPAAPVSNLVKCQYCHEEFEPQRLASVIVCQSCSGIMFEAIALARQEAQQDSQPVSVSHNAVNGQQVPQN